jgi:hypothetical protein
VVLRLVAAGLLITPALFAQISHDHQLSLEIKERSVLQATIEVRCDECAWGVRGREGAHLMATVDGRYAVHIPVVRSGIARYDVLLGTVERGTHVVMVSLDAERTPVALRPTISWRLISVGTAADPASAYAPFLYARPGALESFTDVPVVMWYEKEPTPRGMRYRYSVIFTNEDGGTPADRLMATWGRTTDIEYVYSVELDLAGNILAEDYQGRDHVTTPFRGKRDGHNPLLWVVTENNMVSDAGSTRFRYAPRPVFFQLRGVSREAVMDSNSWLYVLMAQELEREGKIVHDAPPGRGTIPDPRRFVYLEACGEIGTAALAFAVRAKDDWISSDRGIPEYRVVRDGCFRVAIPLPEPLNERDVTALRAQVFQRPPRDGSPAPPATPVRLTSVNTVFMLDGEYRPGRPRLHWTGTKTLLAGGPPVEFPIP